jgi:hypothetical protein
MHRSRLPLLSTHSRCRGCLFSLGHIQTHTTVGRTPLDEGNVTVMQEITHIFTLVNVLFITDERITVA